jgi:hypothetical protein
MKKEKVFEKQKSVEYFLIEQMKKEKLFEEQISVQYFLTEQMKSRCSWKTMVSNTSQPN